MVQKSLLIKRVAIAVRPGSEEILVEGDAIRAWLETRGVDVLLTRMDDPGLKAGIERGEFDLLIALGGDGTMLRAGHVCAPLGIPVLGVNLGHFGFLMEISRNNWRQKLPLLIEGRYRIEDRMMLKVAHLRGQENLGEWSVLNEVVVCRGQVVRLCA